MPDVFYSVLDKDKDEDKDKDKDDDDDDSQSSIFPWDSRCRSLSSTSRHLSLVMRGKLERVQNARR